MANTIILTSSRSADHTTVTITDGTSYVNPIRSAASVSLRVFKTNYRGYDEEITVTPNTQDPLTVSTWTFTLTADGHYKYKYYLSDVLTATEEEVIYTLTQDARNRAAISASLEQYTDANRHKDVNTFQLLDVMVEGLKEADSSSEFNMGERIARSAAGLI